jgi:hypothetical protein
VKLMRLRLARLSMAVLVSMSPILGGCTHTYQKQVSCFEPGNDKLMNVVPRTGVYSVKWTGKKSDNLRGVDGTQMLLYKGEMAGFETQENGTVVAVGGQRRIALDGLPGNVRYAVWFGRSKEQTHFGREFDKATEVAARVATGSAIVVGAGLAIGAGFYLESKYGDADSQNEYRR